MIEFAKITIRRYRSPDGQPTCCADNSAGQKCQFFAVRNFGSQDVCTLGIQRDLDGPNETSYTRPHADCEVWKDA
jgi:hypothetical protein